MKTRVYKRSNLWWVSYYWPYSGILVAPYATWRSAMNEAAEVEKQREWM